MPACLIGEIFDEYQRAIASVNRIMDLLDTPIQINTRNIHLDVDSSRGDIEFKNVVFSYQAEHQPIIKNLSLHIGTGKTIAIVGSTGSGKSTLVKKNYSK